MTERDVDNGLDEQDRLPWLEAVESDDDADGMSASKLMGFVLAALIALGLVTLGVWWLRSQKAPSGDGQLIAAQEGDYKVKADADDGLKVEGQGDATFAASEGAEAQGKLAQAGPGEAPVTGQRVPGMPPLPPATPAKPSVEATVPASAPKIAPPPATAGGSPVQLGAYGSQVAADQAWAKLAAKHKALASLSKSVEAGPSGGKTVYRLRAMASSRDAAASACNSIKAQGGTCLLP